jgi:hypothetical protein
MNDKEISELRRRLRPDRCNIKSIYGCYVNEQKQIISSFELSLGLMPQEEQEKYLSLFKRTLCGTPGRNLIDLSFRTKQVADSDEHRLLSALRDSALSDPSARDTLCEKITGALNLGTSYLILLAADAYDVPYRAKDGVLQEDAGSEQYTCFLCSICPVKVSKPVLHYDGIQKEFHNRGADWIAASPELGFLFPAFDDRRTNLYGALYYCRDAAASYDAFIDALFRLDPPMPAAVQRETFEHVLSGALEDECSYAVVQKVHTHLSDMITAHKEAKIDEPLLVSRAEMGELLSGCGVGEAHKAAFNVKYDEAFGTGAELPPRNLIDPRQFEIRTPDVVIHVNPERPELVQTRMIGGARYLLIPADEGVEVNGVPLRAAESAVGAGTGSGE